MSGLDMGLVLIVHLHQFVLKWSLHLSLVRLVALTRRWSVLSKDGCLMRSVRLVLLQSLWALTEVFSRKAFESLCRIHWLLGALARQRCLHQSNMSGISIFLNRCMRMDTRCAVLSVIHPTRGYMRWLSWQFGVSITVNVRVCRLSIRWILAWCVVPATTTATTLTSLRVSDWLAQFIQRLLCVALFALSLLLFSASLRAARVPCKDLIHLLSLPSVFTTAHFAISRRLDSLNRAKFIRTEHFSLIFLDHLRSWNTRTRVWVHVWTIRGRPLKNDCLRWHSQIVALARLCVHHKALALVLV